MWIAILLIVPTSMGNTSMEVQFIFIKLKSFLKFQSPLKSYDWKFTHFRLLKGKFLEFFGQENHDANRDKKNDRHILQYILVREGSISRGIEKVIEWIHRAVTVI